MLRIATPSGRERLIECEPGQKLSEAIWLSGAVEARPLCAGLGRCGRCRIRFSESAPEPAREDLERLDPGEIRQGWRLACRHTVPDSAEIRLFLPDESLRDNVAAQPVRGANAWVGIDLGTTSIQWQAATASDPDAARGSLANPQAGAGADIISRLAYALRADGLARLSALGREAIAAILATAGSQGLLTRRVCIAANSAMTEILLGHDVRGLAAAPYRLGFHGGVTVSLALPGFAESVPVVIPPLPAPFVGGDITAGLLALEHEPLPLILVDLGTNAEFALIDQKRRLFLASAPLGPALEGIGPACGQPAGPDVITGFRISPQGLVPVFYADKQPNAAAGISASGYLSLLAILLNLGLLSPDGHFCKPATQLAARVYAPEGERLALPLGQYLEAADIEALLKVKAAFSLTLARLLAAGGLAPAAISAVYIAGALGAYADSEDLATLGFLPRSLAAKTRAAGNTSLAGACILARDPARNDYLLNLCANAEIIQTAADPNYMQAYIGAMRWGDHAA